ncbi:DUF6879 family protein [Herbidospora sp. RD11066]
MEPSFDELLASAKQSALHLEMRDGYMRDDPAFIAWQAGARIDPVDYWPAWRRILGPAITRGVEVRRLRIVSEPVSDYIRFEYDITEGLNLAAGEQVRWLPRRRASDLAFPGNDFWVFDDTAVQWIHFNGDGVVVAREVSEDPASVELCVSSFAAAWERATDHAEYRPA